MSRDGLSWTCWSVTFFHSSFIGTRSPRPTMFVFCSWNMADVKGVRIFRMDELTVDAPAAPAKGRGANGWNRKAHLLSTQAAQLRSPPCPRVVGFKPKNLAPRSSGVLFCQSRATQGGGLQWGFDEDCTLLVTSRIDIWRELRLAYVFYWLRCIVGRPVAQHRSDLSETISSYNVYSQ